MLLAHAIPCGFFLFFTFIFWWAGGQSQGWQYVRHTLQSRELKCATHMLCRVDVSLLSVASFDEAVAMLGRPCAEEVKAVMAHSLQRTES